MRLRAAFLRLFRGQHSEKWFVRGECRGQLGPLENQQPFRPNPNGVKKPHQNVEVAVDYCREITCKGVNRRNILVRGVTEHKDSVRDNNKKYIYFFVS